MVHSHETIDTVEFTSKTLSHELNTIFPFTCLFSSFVAIQILDIFVSKIVDFRPDSRTDVKN